MRDGAYATVDDLRQGDVIEHEGQRWVFQYATSVSRGHTAKMNVTPNTPAGSQLRRAFVVSLTHKVRVL